jgi:hypothetical protein
MKSPQQLLQSIERFRCGFWDRARIDRPPVGVVSEGIFLPIGYLRQKLAQAEVEPGDLNADLCMTDYEFAAADRKVTCDDWIPFNAAWRAVPWLEAMCGCRVRNASGSLGPVRAAGGIHAIAQQMPIPAAPRWFDGLRRQTQRLADACPADCWLSPTILRGPSDVLAAMCGLSEFYLDVHDHPAAVAEAAGRISRLWQEVADMHFALVQPKLGGYGHIFGYWSPEKTVVIQEDVLGMCAPKVYGELFLEHNVGLVRHLGSHVLFHLHSTGYRHWRDVLRIPGLAGLQMTVEANGPALPELLPVLRAVLEQSRLILYVEHGFEHLPAMLRRLPQEGLYLLIPDRFLGSDEQFHEFVGQVWQSC